MEPFDAQMQRIAANRSSSASAILEAVLDLLANALTQGADLLGIARQLVRGQPTMAPVWRACVEALAAKGDADRFSRFAVRARRAATALTRVAVEALAPDRSSPPLHVVTLSYSGAVRRALVALTTRTTVQVSCAEGRPGLEGRRLASDLAAAGIPVTCYSDAAIAAALATADVLVVGADAIGPTRFFNKVGSRLLAAAAAHQGVPAYVLATRDKFLDQLLLDHLALHEGPADEIWRTPPAGVTLRNPYFEATPLDLVSAVITDAGTIGAADVPSVCASTLDAAAREALTLLTSTSSR